MTVEIRVLASDVGRCEGPVWRRDGSVAIVSLDHGRLYQWAAGRLRTLAVTEGGPNGAAEGHGGRLYVAQNGGRPPALPWPGGTGGVQVISPGGEVTWLTRDPVAPNDLCFGPDGMLYVTDPTRRRPARDDGRLWRCDPAGDAELLVSVGWYPNGIAFGPEDDFLYVADTAGSRVVRFPVVGGGLGRPEVAAAMPHGLPDGLAFDVEGNLLVAAGRPGGHGDIQTYDREGRLLDVFQPGPSPAFTNLALDGDGRLLVTDSERHLLLLVEGWPTAGLPLHPFRSAPVPPAAAGMPDR